MFNLPHLSRFALVSLTLILVSLSSGVTQAQSRKTATRTDELDAFVTATGVDNNYAPPLANYGISFGGDYTHFITQFRGLITPSFQVRGTYTPGGSVDLKSIEGGLKVATHYHRLHPYGDFMLGNGYINFPKPPNPDPNRKYKDSSVIYIYGGGLTYDLRLSPFSLMADFQHQYYDLGRTGNNPPVRFYPKVYSLGVVYRIPFKAYKTR